MLPVPITRPGSTVTFAPTQTSSSITTARSGRKPCWFIGTSVRPVA